MAASGQSDPLDLPFETKQTGAGRCRRNRNRVNDGKRARS